MTSSVWTVLAPFDPLSATILALVTVQRLIEVALARRHTMRLLARGAVEVAPGHYPAVVALHAAWLAGLWLFATARQVNVPVLVVFGLLQVGRIWVLVTLSERWTTRIIVLPGAPLVRSGPYRFVSHPNYWIVAGEILVLPLAFGLVAFALIFSTLNAVLLWVRIRVEDAALRRARPPGLVQ